LRNAICTERSQLIPIEWHATAVALDDDQLAQAAPARNVVKGGKLHGKAHPTAAG